MRILYVHQFFATRDSSLGLIRSYEFALRMIEAGHEVTMITSACRLPGSFEKRLLAEGEIDGIRVRSARVSYANEMGSRRRMWAFAAFALWGSWLAVTAGRHDVVFATSTPLTAGIPGWIASSLLRVPFIFEVRDLWPEAAIQMGALREGGFIATAAKRLERFLYRKAVAVVALSPGMAEGVRAEGVAPERIHTIPNSADIDLFVPGPKDPAFVAQHDLAGRFVVGYAGAIGPSNAVESHIPAAARVLLERGRDDIVFVVAGEGKCLPALREAVERGGLSNVRLAGPLPKREIPALTRSADVLLTLFADVPILATNSPNKLFDGLASGRPMIVNQPGWMRELVERNGAGAYVPAEDPLALAEAIIRLADDPAATERMGRNARALAEREFARDDLAGQLIAVLETAGHP